MTSQSIAVRVFFMLTCFAVGLFLGADHAFKLSVQKDSIAKCATIDRPELRDTTGIAKYTVTYHDGEWTNIECLAD